MGFDLVSDDHASRCGRRVGLEALKSGNARPFIAVNGNLAKGEEFEDARVLRTRVDGEIVWDGDDP